MKTIIIAAGSGTRWKEFRGVPKHLVEVEGERLLDRTVRQFLQHGEVIVAGNDERYKVEGADLFIPQRKNEWQEASKFLDTQEMWATDDRTVVAYGDVWFSDDCIQTIVQYDVPDWVLFGRFGLSEITGGGGECFAQSFWPEQIEEHREALLEIAKLRERKLIGRCGGWEHYRQMNGIPLKEYALGVCVNHPDGQKPHKLSCFKEIRRFVNVNDWTDDFDYPEDLVEWEKRRAEAST